MPVRISRSSKTSGGRFSIIFVVVIFRRTNIGFISDLETSSIHKSVSTYALLQQTVVHQSCSYSYQLELILDELQ